MTALMRCPLCGGSEGYTPPGRFGHKAMLELRCASCLGVVGYSVRRQTYDAAWNAAGAHAQGLRDEIARVASALASTGARYLDPPDGGDVPIDEQVRRMAADAQSLRDEIHDYDMLREKMAAILSATAVVLKGPAPELTGWSWHDLPEHAALLRDRVAFLEDSIKRVVRRYRSGHPAEMSEYIGEFLIATLETGPEDIVWPEEQEP